MKRGHRKEESFKDLKNGSRRKEEKVEEICVVSSGAERSKDGVKTKEEGGKSI